MNILRETMTTVQLTSTRKMRVWRQRALADQDPGRMEIKEHVAKLVYLLFVDELVICQHMLELEGVNAVEVVDQAGNGEVLYKDWP